MSSSQYSYNSIMSGIFHVCKTFKGSALRMGSCYLCPYCHVPDTNIQLGELTEKEFVNVRLKYDSVPVTKYTDIRFISFLYTSPASKVMRFDIT